MEFQACVVFWGLYLEKYIQEDRPTCISEVTSDALLDLGNLDWKVA